SSSPEILVALHAKLGLRVVGSEVLVGRPMRVMAAHAVRRRVLVALVDDLLADRMARVPLPVVAAPAQLEGVRVGEEMITRRRMRIVTDRTVAALHRRMLRDRSGLLLEGIRMARPAEALHRRGEQSLAG